MAKEDFCFTYYDGDAARDKAHMNRLERGAYDDLISAQRKRGHLTLDDIKKVLSGDFEKCWSSLEWILEKDAEGKYFIEWVDKSLEKMRRHSQKQKEKADKRWNKDAEELPQQCHGIDPAVPLENGNETITDLEKGVQGEKHLVPEMLRIFKAAHPSYPESRDKDFRPLYAIAVFIGEKLGATGPPGYPKVLDHWKTLVVKISKDRFYKSKSLSTISNHIQEIFQLEDNAADRTTNSAIHKRPSKSAGAELVASRLRAKMGLRGGEQNAPAEVRITTDPNAVGE